MSEKTIFHKIKEAGSHTIIYGLGSILQTALGFFFIPLYTRYYTTDMYGALSLINLCGTLAGAVFFLGASSALARSYYDYDDPGERKKVISTSLYITLFGAALQIFLGFVLGGLISVWLFKTTDYRLHIGLILLSTALGFINALFYMVLRFERMSKQVVTLNIVSLILSSLSIVFFLVWMKLGVLAPILGGLLNQSVVFVVLFVMVRKNLVLGYSARELKIQIPFGVQAVIIGVAYYSFDWLNRFFINKYCSLGDVGIYSLGYQIGMVVNILLILPFSQIWAPMRMQYRNDVNADEFYRKMLTYYFLAGFMITVPISIFSREIITILAGKKEYIDSCRVVPFVMFGMMIYGAVNIIDNGIYFSRKVVYHAYIFWITSLISLALNYLLVPRFGYMAAAVIILISYGVVFSLVFIVSNRLYRIPYEGKRLVVLFAVGITTIIVGNNVPIQSLAGILAFKVFILIVMLFVIYLQVLSNEEKTKIASVLGGMRRGAA